jgi:hypothetical protein
MNIGEYFLSQYIIMHSQARAIWYTARDNIHQYSSNNPILLHYLTYYIVIIYCTHGPTVCHGHLFDRMKKDQTSLLTFESTFVHPSFLFFVKWGPCCSSYFSFLSCVLYVFVYTCTRCCPCLWIVHICTRCCPCLDCLYLYPMLPMSLDCPYLFPMLPVSGLFILVLDVARVSGLFILVPDVARISELFILVPDVVRNISMDAYHIYDNWAGACPVRWMSFSILTCVKFYGGIFCIVVIMNWSTIWELSFVNSFQICSRFNCCQLC